jgi:3-mercaptopyruvate sulfurtransferase SseA
MSEYANGDVLVSTSWVAENSGKTNIRVVEVDVDTKTYDEGHISKRSWLVLEHTAL